MLGIHHPYDGTERVVAPHAFGQAEIRGRPDPDTIRGHFPNRAYDDAHGGPQFFDSETQTVGRACSPTFIGPSLLARYRRSQI
jgi:hypothetical protein